MLNNLLIVLPIFALILTGWIARKSGALGPNATREVNRLVVYLALPAVLFDIVANAKITDLWEPGLIAAFTLGCFIVFAGTLWWRVSTGHHLADAAIDGLNASYANTGFVGFPLVLSLVGDTGMAPTLIATIVTVCVLFVIAIVLIEAGLQTEARRRDIVAKTLFSLVKNPLLVAPALGGLVMVSGGHLPGPVHAFLKLLGGAASPCALIALGLFLAGNSANAASAQPSTAAILVGLKLIAQPLVTWIIAAPVLHLPLAMTNVAVLLAALPTGTGSFMLAEFYDREAALTGRVVLASTVFSIATISLYLAFTPA
ncbi:AEC family transporter [Acetobacter senegalensis]|uniref:Transporter n=1 Tax=Acetobacter senegalensis TaxID=446692 RepID=A0A149U567_9PROT|nr:AEC family transporter [Acetobacter senegalensis]KXV60486.1 transporter [Acetobacter senegalensis]MCG4258348.1 AEC family transporter [Acetobacter senegalensis]MCG4268206.1 AEC family transporter [Acetobacter senegalensis]MPQ72623.1 AEC family transporter [Acetobacter senegalensis]